MIIRRIVGYPFVAIMLVQALLLLASVYTFGILMGHRDRVERIVSAVNVTIAEQNKINRGL